MAYESDVRKQAGNLRNSAQNARNEKKKVGACVDSSNQWWKGEGGEAFAREYRNIDQDADRFLGYLQGAIDGMNRLPALIQRAEQERRKAAEKKAAEEAKKAARAAQKK